MFGSESVCVKLAQVLFDLVVERRNFDDVAVFEPSSVETYDVAVFEPLCVELFTTKAVKLEPTRELAIEPSSGQIFWCVREPFKEEQWRHQTN